MKRNVQLTFKSFPLASMLYPIVVSQKQPAATSLAMFAPISTLVSLPPRPCVRQCLIVTFFSFSHTLKYNCTSHSKPVPFVRSIVLCVCEKGAGWRGNANLADHVGNKDEAILVEVQPLDKGDTDAVRGHVVLDLVAQTVNELMWYDKDEYVCPFRGAFNVWILNTQA